MLPPVATFGLMLALNIVCVNFAAKPVFLLKGIHPRTWREEQKARQSMITCHVIWAVSLAILAGLLICGAGCRVRHSPGGD